MRKKTQRRIQSQDGRNERTARWLRTRTFSRTPQKRVRYADTIYILTDDGRAIDNTAPIYAPNSQNRRNQRRGATSTLPHYTHASDDDGTGVRSFVKLRGIPNSRLADARENSVVVVVVVESKNEGTRDDGGKGEKEEARNWSWLRAMRSTVPHHRQIFSHLYEPEA